jgi:hypothetical protein
MLCFIDLLFIRLSVVECPSDVVQLEISRFYGDGTNYKAVWGRCQTFLRHAEAQKLAVETGIDPNTLEFKEVGSGKAYKGNHHGNC